MTRSRISLTIGASVNLGSQSQAELGSSLRRWRSRLLLKTRERQLERYLAGSLVIQASGLTWSTMEI